jgi:hypothetical protein
VGTGRPGAGMPVRHAGLDDADEVIRLAGLMYEAMSVDASSEAWHQMAADHLRRRRWATTSWWLWLTVRRHRHLDRAMRCLEDRWHRDAVDRRLRPLTTCWAQASMLSVWLISVVGCAC